MPQMSPLSWWLLFIYFILLLAVFSIVNYYIFFYTPQKQDLISLKTKSMNWKW
uniref:ATP synthase F0 subunit 8 n=1 Tax=Austrogymnocnemia maculata TaxID=2929828 RepID=UPI00207A5C01|nr:ATP synthase F0 subunit 8 [Austrogymnocnemia maculata]URT60714.1 ATP synthase F0 subunit 8 [Austrogymnocnemia maculata]